MNNKEKIYSEKDREFIEGIKRKVRYLEYINEENEKIKYREKELIHKKLTYIGLSSVITLIFSITTFVIFGLSQGTIVIAGSCVLGLFSFMENSQACI